VDEVRRALAAEPKRLEATERTHTAEVARVREALAAGHAERAHDTPPMACLRKRCDCIKLQGMTPNL
jgi:hypothetical protein